MKPRTAKGKVRAAGWRAAERERRARELDKLKKRRALDLRGLRNMVDELEAEVRKMEARLSRLKAACRRLESERAELDGPNKVRV